MKSGDSRQAFKRSLIASSLKKWGGQDVTKHVAKLADALETSRTQATRLMEGETDVRVSTIDKLCDTMGLEPWQVLVPDFDAANPPKLAIGASAAAMRFSREVLERFGSANAEDVYKLENMMRSYFLMEGLPRPEGFQPSTAPKSAAQKFSPGEQPERRSNGDRRTGTG